MIEQESHEADNPSRVPSARQARYESVAASTAMLVRALSGRPLALPLWHRVRAVWMPTLGSAPLVAADSDPPAESGQLNLALADPGTTE